MEPRRRHGGQWLPRRQRGEARGVLRVTFVGGLGPELQMVLCCFLWFLVGFVWVVLSKT